MTTARGSAARPEGPMARLLSSSALYAVTGAAQQAIGFLLIPVYTRLIAPADYGALELLTAFLSIAMMCVTLGMSSAINKVYHRDCETPRERDAVVATALMTVLPAMLLVGGALVAVAGPLSAFLTGSADNARLLRMVAASSLCYGAFALLLGGFRAAERARAYSVLSIVQFSLALGLNLAFVAGARLGVEGVVLGNLCANVAALSLGVVLLGPGRRLAFERRLVWPLLAFGLAVLPGMLAGWVMDVSDRYLLRIFRTLDEVAQYGVGYKFGLAVQLLVTWPFQLAWPAIAFGISKDDGHERTFARVLTYLVLVLTAVLLVVVAASRSVLPVIVGAGYTAGCAVVPIVALAYALNALQYCIAPGIHIGGRTRSLSAIGVGSAVANLALGLLLIPHLGMLGAAWATVGAYALALAGAGWLAQRSHPVRWEAGRLARIVGAGLVAWILMEVVSANAAGVWLFVGQGAVVSGFLALAVSGFVTADERAQLAGFLHRYVQT